jgi:hypothetical protein
MKRFLHLFLLMLVFFFTSCAQQTEEQQMFSTAEKAIAAIKTGSEKDFKNLLGLALEDISKTDEMFHFDFVKLSKYYKTYVGNRSVAPVLIEEPNSLGQKVIQVPFHKGAPNSDIPYDIRLDIYFGPPNFFSLNKLSGYKIVDRSDALVK